MDEPAPASSFAALGQGTWWVDVEDRPHRLAEMTDTDFRVLDIEDGARF